MFNKILTLLSYRGVQTVLVLVAYVQLADFLPYHFHQLFYTVSLAIKDILMLVMPLTIGFFIAHTVSTFEHKAFIFIVSIIIFEGCSNFISVWYAYGSANMLGEYVQSFTASAFDNNFHPLWRMPKFIPHWWSADKGSIVGLVLGCINAFYKNPMLRKTLFTGKQYLQFILTNIFARLIPIFVLGFAAQMYQTKILSHVIFNYMTLVLWLTIFIVIYLIILFYLSACGSVTLTIRNIKNLLPAGLISLTSGCSLSTMPWTIAGVRKNLKYPHLADAIIPATTNIQQIGDCIAQTFLCFMIYKHFHGHAPDLITWFNFSVVFVLARFATAAMLGGAIFIMLPIYESYLGFDSEMIAIILALNVVLDPIITSSNVMANGALCSIFETLFNKLQDTVFSNRSNSKEI